MSLFSPLRVFKFLIVDVVVIYLNSALSKFGFLTKLTQKHTQLTQQ